ncbi:MAG: hypothetical protein ACLP6G_24160 [Terriglobales bacterium]
MATQTSSSRRQLLRELPGDIGELPGGAGELPSGTDELSSGVGELSSGVGELPSGVGELSSGVGELPSGAGELRAHGGAARKNGLLHGRAVADQRFLLDCHVSPSQVSWILISTDARTMSTSVAKRPATWCEGAITQNQAVTQRCARKSLWQVGAFIPIG